MNYKGEKERSVAWPAGLSEGELAIGNLYRLDFTYILEKYGKPAGEWTLKHGNVIMLVDIIKYDTEGYELGFKKYKFLMEDNEITVLSYDTISSFLKPANYRKHDKEYWHNH